MGSYPKPFFPKILYDILPFTFPTTVVIFPYLFLYDKLHTKVADLFFFLSNFFKRNFIALKKLPCFFARRAEYIPGLLFNAFIHKPESSEITG